MSDDEEKKCDEPVYHPTREDMLTPFRVGKRYTPPHRRYPNKAVIAQPVNKTHRRIARKLLKPGQRVEKEIAATRAVFTEPTNSHAKKRLLKQERAYRRERRAEEQRLALKLNEKRIAEALSGIASTPSPSDSTAFASQSPLSSTTLQISGPLSSGSIGPVAASSTSASTKDEPT